MTTSIPIAAAPARTVTPAADPGAALRTQIAALVQQYADLTLAPKPFVPGESAVPVSGKVIGAKELQLMVEASLDGWLTTGRFNAAFEERLAKYLGV
jgi:CDP-4-dehydro-6-deoxyglucose reductase, E1